MSSSSQEIGFRCIYEKKDFLLKENLSFYHEEIDHFKFLSISTTMLIKLISGKYGNSATFNVVDLSPFDVGDGWDSRTNPSQEGENDMNHDQGISIPQGPITRTRAKKLEQTLYTCIQAMVSSSSRRRWKPPLYVVQSCVSRKRCIKCTLSCI